MRVLVIGDSWAGGEFARDHSSVEPVLVRLLENDGHTVIQQYNPGDSDIPTIESVREHFNNVDRILFFKTETCRMIGNNWNESYYNQVASPDWPAFGELINLDLQTGISRQTRLDMKKWVMGRLVDFVMMMGVTDDINTLFESLSHRHVHSELELYKDKIVMLGGLEDLRLVTKYDYRLSYRGSIDSVINLLLDKDGPPRGFDCHAPQAVVIKALADRFLTGEHHSKILLGLFDLMANTVNINEEMRDHPKYFYPDGVHPNRAGIIKYYQHIKEIM